MLIFGSRWSYLPDYCSFRFDFFQNCIWRLQQGGDFADAAVVIAGAVAAECDVEKRDFDFGALLEELPGSS